MQELPSDWPVRGQGPELRAIQQVRAVHLLALPLRLRDRRLRERQHHQREPVPMRGRLQ